jgi:hypothetical protein
MIPTTGEHFYCEIDGRSFGPVPDGKILNPYPPVESQIVNGIRYDTVATVTDASNSANYIWYKIRFGILRIHINGNNFDRLK